MSLERALPGEKLFFREVVTAAGFLDRNYPAPYCGEDGSFAANHPSLGVWRRQVNHWGELLDTDLQDGGRHAARRSRSRQIDCVMSAGCSFQAFSLI
jgi:hypothetical protein